MRDLLPPRALWIAPLLALALAVAVACTGDDDGDGDAGQPAEQTPQVEVQERLQVVGSTGIIAHFAEQIAGDDADVASVIPPGADAHSFTATTTSIRNIAAADLVIVNGYNLEESTLATIFANLPEDARLAIATVGITPLEGGHHHHGHDHGEGEDGHDEEMRVSAEHELAVADGDPHMWLTIPNAMVYVRNIANAIVDADPANAAAYREREAAYLAELQKLDEEVRATIATIPQESRVLIVYHDAFQYFSAEYGLELAATVLPGNPSQQASAAAVAEIIEIVAGRQVGAVYREPQFAADAIEAIAEEAGVRVLTLYSAAFTDEVDTYVKLMRANAESLVEGLGGG
ncbi:MAG: zinc ABC transporter substrate-binding protein [Chloroflexi bacterium]|nr:zinc ABC transporter substrate-binding protein [Chloroflexota bacterium]